MNPEEHEGLITRLLLLGLSLKLRLEHLQAGCLGLHSTDSMQTSDPT